MGIVLFFAEGAAAMFGVWVEDKGGTRFINELANRKVCDDAIMTLLNKGTKCYAVADSLGTAPMEVSRPGLLAKMLERGCVRKYETLEALADGEKINLECRRASIAEWNKAVEEGKDAHYGRYVNKLAKPMSQGPRYVSQMVPKVHHCTGGILTDMAARAMDCTANEPIPGSSPPAKPRAACTAPFVSAPAPLRTASSTGALPQRALLPPLRGNNERIVPGAMPGNLNPGIAPLFPRHSASRLLFQDRSGGVLTLYRLHSL